VIQASLREHVVTLTAAGKVLASRLAFGSFTGYRTVSPGTWNVRATGQTEHASARVRLAAGTIHTIVILDDPGHLAIISLEDAAGSRVAPQGGAQTGFGGTAARPGGALLPWLLATGAGLVLAACGVIWLRRRPRRTALHAR
jgi:hypothetical protein